jgi:hypothetical protein
LGLLFPRAAYSTYCLFQSVCHLDSGRRNKFEIGCHLIVKRLSRGLTWAKVGLPARSFYES